MNTRYVFVILFSIFFQTQLNAKGIFLKAGFFQGNELPVQQTLSIGETLETDYFIVQFKESLNESHRQMLEKNQIQIIRYIPDDAFLVKSTPEAILALELTGELEGVVPYLASFKVSPQFEKIPSNETSFIELQLTQALEVPQVLKELKNFNVQKVQGRIILIKAGQKDLSFLSSINGVEWIQPQSFFQMMHAEVVPFEEENSMVVTGAGDYSDINGYESGVKIMKFSKAWERGFKGEGQIGAMADTGLDTGNLGTLSKDFSGVFDGQALGLFSDSWGDPMGHGTHVAGSVVSRGSDSLGKITGGAIEGQLLAQGMWSKVFKNLTIPPDLKTLFQKAYEKEAKIHTNSWGAPFNLGAYDKNAMLVDEFMWEHPDMLIIFAAGNSGKDEDKDGRIDLGSVSSPGTAKNVLTVGASENLVSHGGIQRTHGELRGGKDIWGVSPIKEDTLSNNENGIAAFSSRGPAKDGRLKPEVVAPGTNILSNCSHDADASPLWGKYNEDYCWSGGTSMSTPLTAGAALIAREYLVKERKVEKPSAALIKASLMHTAFDMFPGQYGLEGNGQEMLQKAPNNQEGFGRVDMDTLTSEVGITHIEDDNVGVASSSSVEFNYDVSGKKEAKFTLVYTDAPGSPSAAKALVNDLNLEVQVGGQTLKAERDLENFEQLMISDLKGSATIQVKVIGQRIAQGKEGKQPFALVVSFK